MPGGGQAGDEQEPEDGFHHADAARAPRRTHHEEQGQGPHRKSHHRHHREERDDLTVIKHNGRDERHPSRHERGGILTEQLRDNPYTVLLLDEVEKANPYLMNIFLQAFDEGWITDGRGKKVYLSDAIVIMTSNLGSENFKKYEKPLGFGQKSLGDMKQIRGDVMKAAETRFTPEFRNRIDEIVVFSPLTMDEVRDIARLYLGKVKRNMERQGKFVEITEGGRRCLD